MRSVHRCRPYVFGVCVALKFVNTSVSVNDALGLDHYHGRASKNGLGRPSAAQPENAMRCTVHTISATEPPLTATVR